MWILLAEDEKPLARSIRQGLQEEGHVVEVCYNGEEAELQGISNDYDIVILDWRLPRKEGKSVLQAWRKAGRQFPVLMLTALSDLDHKVAGLDAGADDYMSKPFSFEELLARIRALGRRKQELHPVNRLEAGPLSLDLRGREAYFNSRKLDLRMKEFVLLSLFLDNPDTVITKTQIAERGWGAAEDVRDNVIEATISTLRHKLADAAGKKPSEVAVIETLRGTGYRLNTSTLSRLKDV